MSVISSQIRFSQDACVDVERAIQHEWLETNGLGGFSSSTIVGLNTRRYHGLLTAATKPPLGRLLLLSKVEETLVVEGRRHELSTNQYPGVIYPRGYLYMREFRLDPFPTFLYQADGVEIEKRIFMVHGENTVVIEYELRSIDRDPLLDCVLELRPLIAFRDYHSTTHANAALDSSVQTEQGRVSIRPYEGLPTLHLAHNAIEVEQIGYWYYNLEYRVERERGLDFQEDLFSPLVLRFPLRRNTTATLVASTEKRDASASPRLKQEEVRRRERIAQTAPSADPLMVHLAAAADQFIVQRGELNTIIAGYHWFGDWGRDTMIAIPGLTLVTGRPDIARNILRSFAGTASQGMLPNRFPDAGDTPEFNTVDGTLWFFEAVRAYLHYTSDYRFVRDHLYATLVDIVEWHCRGTRFQIHADEDGLISCGEPGTQLTWMDARVGDSVVTPRMGKPVEIQALWYNALRTLQDLARNFGEKEKETALRDLADRVHASFNAAFWNSDAGCLYDVVNRDYKDPSIRPNQVFAVSLHHGMLTDQRASQIMEVIQRDLFTPLGLRTLSPHDSQYRPRCEGSVSERDSAYHQGTVWPWLMGPFISAYIKTAGATKKSRQQAKEWIEYFAAHLLTGGLGQVSEIADAEAPHTPRGCIAQAWSVAELLRAFAEDVLAGPAPTGKIDSH